MINKERKNIETFIRSVVWTNYTHYGKMFCRKDMN